MTSAKNYFSYKQAELTGQMEEEEEEEEETFHGDYCKICKDGGELLCCDFCPGTYHMKCVKPKLISVPEGEWKCPMCKVDDLPEKVERILFWKFYTHHPSSKLRYFSLTIIKYLLNNNNEVFISSLNFD